jgi:hypothetical protein
MIHLARAPGVWADHPQFMVAPKRAVKEGQRPAELIASRNASFSSPTAGAHGSFAGTLIAQFEGHTFRDLMARNASSFPNDSGSRKLDRLNRSSFKSCHTIPQKGRSVRSIHSRALRVGESA